MTDAGAAPPTTELLDNVDFLSIGGSVTTAFAGINGGTEDAIGFNLSDAQFALLIVTDPGDDPHNESHRKKNRRKTNRHVEDLLKKW